MLMVYDISYQYNRKKGFYLDDRVTDNGDIGAL
jgi:hypothetical protein